MIAQDFTPAADVKVRQRAVLLALLKQGPVSTLQARSLSIMSPASRCFELRKAGWQIDTERRLSADEHGRMTRCAWYVLKGGAH